MQSGNEPYCFIKLDICPCLDFTNVNGYPLAFGIHVFCYYFINYLVFSSLGSQLSSYYLHTE